MIKYFQFKDTINGTGFILRYVLSVIVIMMFAYSMGYFFGVGQYGLAVVCAFLMSLGVLFNYATYYKRIKALYPQHLIPSMVILIVFNVITTLDIDPLLKSTIGLGSLIYNLVLIFNNSDILHHKG
jgi:hypothetical protein